MRDENQEIPMPHTGTDPDESLAMFDFYVAQLEAYLDGELDADEAAAVRDRLGQEPTYAAALDRLHRERAQRVSVFEAIEHQEVDDAAVNRLMATARRLTLTGDESADVDTLEAEGRSWPLWVKVVSGMAACVLVGFAGGLVGGLDFGDTPARPNPTPMADSGRVRANNAGMWVYYNEEGEPSVRMKGQDPQEMGVLPTEPTVPQPPR